MRFRMREAAKTRGAEKDHGVLNFFATKTRERFGVFGQNAKNASVRAVEVFRIQIGERGWIQARLFRTFAGKFDGGGVLVAGIFRNLSGIRNFRIAFLIIAVCHTVTFSAAVVIVDGFQNPEPYVNEAEAGDAAANKAGLQELLSRGPARDHAIFKPGGRPGQRHQRHPERHAEEYINKRERALQPDRGQLFRVRRWNRRGVFEIR